MRTETVFEVLDSLKTLIMKRILLLSLIFLLLLALPEAYSQCAMCRATVENNVANGVDRIGAGLNFGIMYLLLMPYVLVGVVGWLWYRNSKRSNERKIKIQSLIRSKMSSVQRG